MNHPIQDKVRTLGDLELAILVCLVAQQHCIFSAASSTSQDLQGELRRICTQTFGLCPAILQCSASMTLEEFSEGVLVDHTQSAREGDPIGDNYGRPLLAVNFSSAREAADRGSAAESRLDDRRVADVIIAVDLDLASENVQVQAFELIRSKRIFTRTAMHTTQKDLMILAIASTPGARLWRHLNDLFCMSHIHTEDDGSLHLTDVTFKETASAFSEGEIRELRQLADKAYHTPEIAAYLHNIVVFMRNSRYVQGGVTATATRQLRILAKALAPLHGLHYVPPALIALAVRKIYPHRLILATPDTEASLQWGSHPDAIKQLLKGITIEDAIEDVLSTVPAPL